MVTLWGALRKSTGKGQMIQKKHTKRRPPRQPNVSVVIFGFGTIPNVFSHNLSERASSTSSEDKTCSSVAGSLHYRGLCCSEAVALGSVTSGTGEGPRPLEMDIIKTEGGEVSLKRKKIQKPLSEEKGRKKINSQINELKKLLPECKYVTTTKASILECAAATLMRLRTGLEQLESSNRIMHERNQSIKQQLSQLKSQNGTKYMAPFQTQNPYKVAQDQLYMPYEWKSEPVYPPSFDYPSFDWMQQAFRQRQMYEPQSVYVSPDTSLYFPKTNPFLPMRGVLDDV
ncbi:hypothetical protein PROFUN_03319 [Planoprotostelium fungivorum]|uniref:BHLH domain-containing protein n=1 Tax=Planoprotostelium fungivorum TaxID=1890364 RepID=A0A2P6NWR3_9EUKA|nr:hypothetical protein PROFUN_03319 [Planoprotostelium fungivorum]